MSTRSILKLSLLMTGLVIATTGCTTASTTNTPTSSGVNNVNAAVVTEVDDEDLDETMDSEVGDEDEAETGVSVTNTETEDDDTEEVADEVAPAVTASVKSFTITASQFEFSPSTITVNEGDTVKLTVTSEDTTHGISIPEFGVSKTIENGDTVTVEFVADQAGTFSFFCSVFCGSGHGSMKGTLVVN